jgi:hypothetical protein
MICVAALLRREIMETQIMNRLDLELAVVKRCLNSAELQTCRLKTPGQQAMDIFLNGPWRALHVQTLGIRSRRI